GVRFPDAMRDVHRWASLLLLWTAIALAAIVIVDAVRRRRFDLLVGVSALPAVAALASFSGYLLPWDQLGLWAVTVGSDYGGYRAIWGSDVRFALMGRTEVQT